MTTPLSVLGFGDVLSSAGYDPAENDEGRQLLAASRHARRRAGNYKRVTARPLLAANDGAFQLLEIARRDPAALDQHFDSNG
jgi:hypothetical protein